MSIRTMHKLSGDMVQHGILLLTFGFILCGLKPTRETQILPFVPRPPDCFYTPLGWSLIVISLVVVFVVFWIWRKYKLASFFKRQLKPLAYLITSLACLLLLFIVLLLFFVLWLTSTIPLCFFTALGVIPFLASLVFMVAIFREGLALKLVHFLEENQFPYWQIYWIVYMASWLKGLTSIPTEGLVFKVAYWIAYPVGFAWFLVIPFIMLTATWQRKK